ncbi:YlbF family regulator [Oscillospiraceae bacterium LCP25S3_E10]|nr:YlbF family regulator [Ruminococcus sp.]MDD6447540.1 YlbF family regulator [Ruminococcus sp.]MDY2856558.1 YlbF family regulator [Oscillospiraceae bacterium]
MDMIELAREIGKQIQQDASYISVKAAEQACDEDKDLQQQIADFNMKRMTLSQESNKQPRDDQKVAKLNQELRECYEKVMSNENMANYNNAKTELDHKIKHIIDIITMSAEGADPDTVQEQTDCGHDCSCCGGCH